MTESDDAAPADDDASGWSSARQGEPFASQKESGGEKQRRSGSKRRVWVGVASVLAVVLAFFGVTGATGLDLPGWMHRYPYADLGSMAAAVNDEAGDLRTPDDCWRTVQSRGDTRRDPDGPLREIARVDYVRSRVVVRVYASESGEIDPTTYRSVIDRIDGLLARRPELSWRMLKLEPSPDGWSPLVSCRLVTRGWITGF